MKHVILAAVGLALTLGIVPAYAEDAEGCKDHPLFNRLKGYALGGCQSKTFDDFKFPVGAATPSSASTYKYETVEGRKTELVYDTEEGQVPASPLQVMRNFKTAAKAAGGTVIGEYEHAVSDLSEFGGGDRAVTLRIDKNGHEVWVLVRGEETRYSLMIVEREAMQQEIAANELLDTINKDGFIALYINFDTGKATIKADSLPQLAQVAQALKSAPHLKLEVAGHTDNIGKPAANKTLSEQRAQSVAQALTERGITAARLSAKGYGQDKPIADNTSENGRAKNRRVELVKR